MESYELKAEKLFKSGYNCAQAVVGAFSDELGIDFETAMKLALPFGGGMGGMRGTCGAMSAIVILAGLKKGYLMPDAKLKAEHYMLIQDLAQKFIEDNGSIVCADLLSGNIKSVGESAESSKYKKKPCAEIVKSAARIAKVLFEVDTE